MTEQRHHHVPALGDGGPDAMEQLQLQLVDLLPRPQLTELLIEVERSAGWSDQVTHAGGKTHRDPRLRRNLYAAILVQALQLRADRVRAEDGLLAR